MHRGLAGELAAMCRLTFRISVGDRSSPRACTESMPSSPWRPVDVVTLRATGTAAGVLVASTLHQPS
jgi:hypothetical protein